MDLHRVWKNGESIKNIFVSTYNLNLCPVPVNGTGFKGAKKTYKIMNTNEIIEAYKVCALWASNIDDLTIFDIEPGAAATMEADVLKFIGAAADTLRASGLTADQIGHSLWLTQNRHGAGFFDYSLDAEIEKQLTDAAHNLKEIDLFVDDAGKVSIA